MGDTCGGATSKIPPVSPNDPVATPAADTPSAGMPPAEAPPAASLSAASLSDDTPPPAEPPAPPPPTRGFLRRHAKAVGLLAVLLAGAAAGFGYLAWQRQQAADAVRAVEREPLPAVERAYDAPADEPAENPIDFEALRRESEWREIGLGAQILKDLGISSIRLLTSRERHYVGLEGFGIKITATDIC